MLIRYLDYQNQCPLYNKQHPFEKKEEKMSRTSSHSLLLYEKDLFPVSPHFLCNALCPHGSLLAAVYHDDHFTSHTTLYYAHDLAFSISHYPIIYNHKKSFLSWYPSEKMIW